MYNALYTLT